MNYRNKSKPLFILLTIVGISIFFSPYTIDPFRGSKVSLLYILLAITLFIYIKNCIKSGLLSISKNPIYLPMLAFLSYSLISTIWAEDKYSALNTSLNILAGITFFFLINNTPTLTNKKNRNKILVLIIITALINGSYGLMQYLDIDPLFQQKVNIFDYDQGQSRSKITGFMGNPNLLSDFLALSLPALLVMLLSLRKISQQIVTIAIATVIISNIYLGQSRNSFFSVIIGFIFFFTFLFYKKKDFFKNQKKNIILLILIFIIMLEFLFIFPGLKERIKHENDTIKRRKAIWKTTLNMIIDKPVSGWGIGCFKTKFYDYHIARMIHENYNYEYTPTNKGVDQAHNEYIQILSELGLPGLVLILWILVTFLKFALITMKHNSNYHDNLINIGAITAIVMSCLLSIASFPFHFTLTALTPLLYIGLIGDYSKYSVHKKFIIIRTRKINGLASLIIFVLTGIALLIMSLITVVSNYYAKAGDLEFNAGNFKKSLSFYEKALNLNSHEGEFNFRYGSNLTVNDDYQDAIIYLKRAKKNLLRPEVDIKIGLCYDKLNEKRIGNHYLENAVIFSNYFTNIKIQLGRNLFELGEKSLAERNYFGALNLFIKSKRYHPENSDVYIKIAELYDIMNYKDISLHYLGVALSFNTRNVKVLEKLANIYFDNGNYISAFKYYMKLQYLIPDNERINSLINDKYELILRDYIVKEPEDGFWDFQLFLITSGKGDVDKAYSHLENSIEKGVNIGYAYYLYGNKEYEAGNSIKGAKLYETAISNDPSLIDAYYKLWKYYTSNNDLAQLKKLRKLLQDLKGDCGTNRYISRRTLENNVIKTDEESIITYLGSSYISSCAYITDDIAYLHVFKKNEKSKDDTSNLRLILAKGNTKIYKFEDKFFLTGIGKNKVKKVVNRTKVEFTIDSLSKKENINLEMESIYPKLLLGSNWLMIENNRLVQSTTVTSEIIHVDPSKYYLIGCNAIGMNGHGGVKIGWQDPKKGLYTVYQKYSALSTFQGDKTDTQFCDLVEENDTTKCDLICNYSNPNSGGIFYNIVFIEIGLDDILFEK